MDLRSAIRRRARGVKLDGELVAAGCGLGSRGAVARKLRSQGVHIRNYHTAVSAHLHLLPAWLNLRDGLFVDLGAFVGNWTASVIRAVPGATAVVAEPFPESFETLRRRFSDDPRVRLENVAVDSRRGEAAFHVGRAAVFGSLLEFDPAMSDFYGSVAEASGTITVRTAPLDELVDGPVRVLKIDVQGAELKVLAGGEETLTRTDAVIVEGLLAEHYRGGSSFAALYQELTRREFALWDLDEPFRDAEGRALWLDAAFVRPRS